MLLSMNWPSGAFSASGSNLANSGATSLTFLPLAVGCALNRASAASLAFSMTAMPPFS
jgi:hypothetical protein